MAPETAAQVNGGLGAKQHKGHYSMTDHAPIPVAGYTTQSDAKIALANEGKQLEERYLRWLDKLMAQNGPPDASGAVPQVVDPRCVALAKTHIQDGAMWAIRSIFQPQRISLPEDAH